MSFQFICLILCFNSNIILLYLIYLVLSGNRGRSLILPGLRVLSSMYRGPYICNVIIVNDQLQVSLNSSNLKNILLLVVDNGDSVKFKPKNYWYCNVIQLTSSYMQCFAIVAGADIVKLQIMRIFCRLQFFAVATLSILADCNFL